MAKVDMALGQNQWDHFGEGAPILEPILVVGLNRMFTGGMIWILTHGHMLADRCLRQTSRTEIQRKVWLPDTLCSRAPEVQRVTRPGPGTAKSISQLRNCGIARGSYHCVLSKFQWMPVW